VDTSRTEFCHMAWVWRGALISRISRKRTCTRSTLSNLKGECQFSRVHCYSLPVPCPPLLLSCSFLMGVRIFSCPSAAEMVKSSMAEFGRVQITLVQGCCSVRHIAQRGSLLRRNLYAVHRRAQLLEPAERSTALGQIQGGCKVVREANYSGLRLTPFLYGFGVSRDGVGEGGGFEDTP